MTPQKKYSRHTHKSTPTRLAPIIRAPSLDDSVKPEVSAKARWADLKGRVQQRSTVKASLRKLHLENNDFWDRAAANERICGQLDSSDDSSSDSDTEDQMSNKKKKHGGIKVWVHIHDASYPESINDHVTKFALNPPSQTFLFPLGKGRQDFRWLSISSMRRFTSVYKPQGRVRHREWYIGPGDINLRAQQVYLDKFGSAQQTKQVVKPANDIGKAESDAAQILQRAKEHSLAGSKKMATLPSVQENTPLYKCLKDGDHVWIHFQNGKPTALLAGGSATDMRTVEVFRHTRMHDGVSIAPPPPKLKQIKATAVVKKVFRLEDSVFSKRATRSDSKSFYDTNEYYNKVCEADLSYCTRVNALVGGVVEYNRIKTLLKENYRCIREAFRYHVAQSRGNTFEMTWLDFSSFAKYCKLIDTEGEHPFTYSDLDNIWVTVNCHQNNDAVDQHHVRFLSRFEFLESIVRIAVVKYSGVGAYASVEHLLNAHVVPYFKHMDANVFRRVKLYSPSTAKVFELFKPSLKLAFREYAITCKVMNASARRMNQLSLTRDEFTSMLEAARVMSVDEDGGSTTLTRKVVHGVFVFSQNTVLDEHQRSHRDSLRDDNKTMYVNGCCNFLFAWGGVGGEGDLFLY